MKHLPFLCLLLVAHSSYASCNWASDIAKNTDGTYTYSKACHLEVGSSLEELDLRKKQVIELNKTIELKDLAIKYSDERVQLWMESSLKMNDRLNQYEAVRGNSQWLYFGLGALTVIGAGLIVNKTLH